MKTFPARLLWPVVILLLALPLSGCSKSVSADNPPKLSADEQAKFAADAKAASDRANAAMKGQKVDIPPPATGSNK